MPNISIYVNSRFLETIRKAMAKLGYSSRSDFFRVAARFYLSQENAESGEMEGRKQDNG